MIGLAAFVAGVLFGCGLLISGMTNPANVIAFLDITGAWYPALALTMLGAIAIALPAFAFVRARRISILGRPMPDIDRTHIDAPLVAGSAIFGAGWGLSGICPGPGLMLLASADPRALLFVAGLMAGVYAADLSSGRWKSAQA